MAQTGDSGVKKPLWKKAIKPAIFIAIGILIAFPLFSMSYFTMVRTSSPDFCGSCHEIKPAVVAWRSSTHANNASGVVVDCMDCHLPAPQDTFDFFFKECQKCHRNLMNMPYKRGAMLAHRSVLYARPGYEKKCVDCHYDLVHSERGLVMFRQTRKVPYQAKGLRQL